MSRKSTGWGQPARLSCLLAFACIVLAGWMASVSAQVAASPRGSVAGVTLTDGAYSINVGSDNSFQATGPSTFAYFSPFEVFETSTGDAGWFVFVPSDDALYGPDFANHQIGSDTLQYLVTNYLPYASGALPQISGSGSPVDPLTATTAGPIDAGGDLSFLARTRLVNGDDHVVQELTVFNNGTTQQAVGLFFASQIREATLFHDAASGAVVGSMAGCGALQRAPDGNFFGVAHTPLVPADGYTASILADGSPPPYLVWQQLDLLRNLDDAAQTDAFCPDPGGLGLQWNRSIPPGGSAVVQIATTFAGNFALAPFSATSVAPANGEAGTVVPVTITGNGFLAGTTFDFGPDITVGNTTVTDTGTATVVLTIDASAAVGARDVVAIQSPDGVTSTIAGGFAVDAGVVPLALTDVVPPNGEAGTSLAVTVNGAGFDAGLALDFGADIAVSDLNVIGPSAATLTLTIDPSASPGPRDVTATQSGDVATLPGGFTVDPAAVPLGLTAVAPANGEAGTSLAVTVTGAGFGPGLEIDFGAGIAVTNVSVQDAGTALANLDIGADATPGPRDVTATQAGEVATLVGGFTVDPAFVPLGLAAVAPANGEAGSSLAVTVTGAGFDSGLALDFGPDIAVTNLSVQDAGTALANLDIDAGAAPGPRDVVASQGTQVATLDAGFTVDPVVGPPPLVVLGVAPDHAAAGSTVAVTIDVSGLGGGAVHGSAVGVDFGAGIVVSDVSADFGSTPQHVFATLDIDADATPGPRTVTVTNAGDSAELAGGFVVDATLPADFALETVHPASGAQGTLVLVLVTGSGFQTDTTFDFGGGTLVRDLDVLDPGRATLNLQIAADALPGARTVRAIQSPGGAQAELPGAFTVVEAPPVEGGEAGALAFGLGADTAGPLQVGDAFAYTLSVRNFSGDPVGSIRVEDPLPARLAVTGLECDGGSIADGVLTWSLAALGEQQGASCVVGVVLESLPPGGSVVNQASVEYVAGDGQLVRFTARTVVGTMPPPRVESVTVSGAPTTRDSIDPALSADGSILVFSSLQKDLVEDNPNGSDGADVYLRDRRSGQTRVINRDADGNPLVGESRTPAVSLNGQAVAFAFRPAAPSQSLAKGEGDSGWQLCSSQPNALFQMECDTTGVDAAPLDGDVESPSFSADGKSLVFCSSASNWVEGDTNGAKDVFLKDQESGEVTRISVAVDGSEADGDSCDPVISADGSFVAFTTRAPVLGGSPDAQQIVRKDLASGELLLVAGTQGEPANSDMGPPSISADGSRIAFASRASNLVPGAGGVRNLFVFEAGEPGPASLAKGGGSANSLFVMRGMGDELPDGDTSDPKIACSGNAVGFTSEAGNLVAGDANQQNDFFVFGIDSGEITRPGADATGTEPNGDASGAALDCEATTGAYDSTATDAGNPNPNADVVSQEDPLRATSDAIVLDGSFSGNWYDPAQSGHGFLLEALPGGDFYVTWYTYHDGEPLFLQGRATPVGDQLEVSMFDARSTGFPVGAGGPITRTWGDVRLTFLSSNDATVSWTPAVDGFMPGTMNLRRLTRVALVQGDREGTSSACYSGIWYDRANSGYGFDIEFNDMADGSRTATAYWYTYQPDGTPLWLIGTGPADPDGTVMDLYFFDGAGAQFPPAFAAAALSRVRWGQATLRFSPDGLRVDYASSLPGYGSGRLDLERLTLLEGRACGQ